METNHLHSIDIGADDVLRGQGADPAIIRTRSMDLVEIANQALKEAEDYLEPRVWKKTLAVSSVGHEKITLENGTSIKSKVIVNHLKAAETVTAIICTIGSKIDILANEKFGDKMVYALAIDGVGSAGVESLANTVCAKMETDFQSIGQNTTIPLSPGMVGWPVEEGQPVIFEMLANENVDVELTDYFLMKPKKTLSMLIGAGEDILSEGKICDYCQMNKTCKFKGHYQDETK